MIKGAVKLYPRNFNKFLDILKQNTGYGDLADILQREYERLGSIESEFPRLLNFELY